MNPVFHIQSAKIRRRNLVSAIMIGVCGALILAGAASGVRSLLGPGILVLGSTIFHLLCWNRERRTPEAAVELEPDGIRFTPAEFWGVELIHWDQLENVKPGFLSLWLDYTKDGMGKTRDLPRNWFRPDDWQSLCAGIQNRFELAMTQKRVIATA